jgi:hypothetical protein
VHQPPVQQQQQQQQQQPPQLRGKQKLKETSGPLFLTSEYYGNIYLTWYLSSDKFHYLNYKSFESLLITYPNAFIHIFIIAPQSANYYKIGKIFSKTTLQKYIKRFSSNIYFRVIHEKTRIFSSSRSLFSSSSSSNTNNSNSDNDKRKLTESESSDLISLGERKRRIPGERYWKKGINKFCESRHINNLRDKDPAAYHYHLYYLLVQLYQNGGLFIDFSWFHTKPIISGLESRLEYAGYHFKTVCSSNSTTNSFSSFQSSSKSSNKSPTSSSMTCETSTILAFSRKHPILSCVLQNFNESFNPFFLTCLFRDHISKGFFCLEHEFKECFQQLKYPNLIESDMNDLLISVNNRERRSLLQGEMNSLDKQEEKEVEEEEEEETSRVFGVVDGESRRMLTTDLYAQLEKEKQKYNEESLLALSSIKGSCYYISDQKDHIIHKLFPQDPTSSSSSCSLYPSIRYDSYLLQSSSYYQKLQEYSLLSDTRYTRIASLSFPIVWLGLSSYSGDWKIPAKNSLLDYLITQNNERIQRKIKSDTFLLDSPLVTLSSSENASFPTCHHYSILNSSSSFSSSSSMSQFASDSSLSSSLSSKISEYQSILERRSSLSCSLMFVIPGFMKAGTSYFYNSIMKHPLLVKALTGVQFKETGCYLDLISSSNGKNDLINTGFNQRNINNLLKKKGKVMNCFPFIEINDNMYYGDATVYYSTRENVPSVLYEDNPSLKVLFSLRNPIERTLSHHRFTYRYLLSQEKGNINHCLEMVLDDKDGALSRWHTLAKEILSSSSSSEKEILTKQLITSYFLGLGKQNPILYNRCGHLILYSLYFMPIYHWFSIFPKENIKLLDIHYLKPSVLSKEEKNRLLKEPPVLNQMNWTNLFIFNEEHEKNKEMEEQSQQGRDRRSLIDLSMDGISLDSNSIDNDYMLHQLNGVFRFVVICFPFVSLILFVFFLSLCVRKLVFLFLLSLL